MGEKEKALEQLEYAMTLDVEDINAHLQKVCGCCEDFLIQSLCT